MDTWIYGIVQSVLRLFRDIKKGLFDSKVTKLYHGLAKRQTKFNFH